jgi:MFS family permease
MPTRLQSLTPRQRWLVLGLAAAAVVLLVWVSLQPAAPAGGGAVTGPGQGDLASYQRIIEKMRGGEGYYDAAHEVLVADGYGTRSVFNWRTPAWPMLLAALPAGWGQGLLAAVALAGLVLSYAAARRDGGIVPAVLVLVAVGGSLGGLASPSSVVFAEVAAGTVMLFSVAAYGMGWRWAGLVAALAALFLRELAAPYVVVAAVLALRERRWGEVVAWVAGGLTYAGYFGWHWWNVMQQLGPMDRDYAEGWVQFGGVKFLLAAAGFNGLWSLAPSWLAALVLPLGLLGLWAWRGGTLALATVVAYLVLIAVVGKPFNYYWGALFTPLLMLGAGWGLYGVIETVREARRR